MTLPDRKRIRRFGVAELAWRAREATATAAGRVAAHFKPPAWQRGHLRSRLASHGELAPLRHALAAGRWHDAHQALASYVSAPPARFVLAPAMRPSVVAEITRRFPAAAADAAGRGDALLAGRYELLGYRDVAFDGQSWHTDPVHGRSAPATFWSTVPFLDASCGDHKVTWEFNRHQHWIELGRAYWLTGDARYRAECLRQLDSWLAGNPPLMGMNWASMLELAFRSLSWIWAAHFFADDTRADDSPWLVDLMLGLDRQLTHIERHLSYYFSPNTHLLGEALALYVGGRALPLFRASARRARLGRRVLLQEMGRQIAADGGHCERSAHYHRYTLDFYLLALAVARVTDDPVAPTFERACARLGDAARLIADGRGQLPQLGDDDGGSLFPMTRRPPTDARDSLSIAAALTGRMDLSVGDPPEEAWWLLSHPQLAEHVTRLDRSPRPVPRESSALPVTGYYVSRNAHGDHLVLDGGPHGYLNGGHAHADALALTFTSRQRPLLIDTGTACYTIDADTRDRFRSSLLHNTLTLNGRSQSVPRGPFHWRHRADGRVRRWRTNRRFDYFVGTHDGYAPLAHYRHVLMLHADLLVVADCVTAPKDAASPGRHHAAVHWHLHPDWAVELADRAARFTADDREVTLHVAGGSVERFHADAESGLGWYAPAYGRIVPTTALRLATAGELPLWIVSAFTLDPGNGVRTVSLAQGGARREALSHGTAIRIEREHSIDRVVIAEPHGDTPVRWCTGGVDSDAALLFDRSSLDEVLTTMALVDATTWRDARHPAAHRSFPARVPAVFEELAAAPKRKAS